MEGKTIKQDTRKKAVFFDIDGTLIDAAHGQPFLTPVVKKALRELRQQGHYIFIATGRPYAFLNEEIRSFGFDGFVLMNGAAVLLGNEVIYSQAMEDRLVQPICDTCEKHGIEYVLNGIHHAYLSAAAGRLRNFYEDFHIDTQNFVTEFDRHQTLTYKMEFLAGDEAGASLYDSFLSEELASMQDPFHRMNLELYSSRETKGTGILHALQHLEIPVERSFAFGDGSNDFEMIETVGTGLVMGNAGDALKARGDRLVPSVHEDGVAAGIRDYILD